MALHRRTYEFRYGKFFPSDSSGGRAHLMSLRCVAADAAVQNLDWWAWDLSMICHKPAPINNPCRGRACRNRVVIAWAFVSRWVRDGPRITVGRATVSPTRNTRCGDRSVQRTSLGVRGLTGP